jgi:hypothetical protein
MQAALLALVTPQCSAGWPTAAASTWQPASSASLAVHQTVVPCCNLFARHVHQAGPRCHCLHQARHAQVGQQQQQRDGPESNSGVLVCLRNSSSRMSCEQCTAIYTSSCAGFVCCGVNASHSNLKPALGTANELSVTLRPNFILASTFAACRPGFGGPSCTKCSPGTYSSGGRARDGSGARRPCPAGTTSPSEASIAAQCTAGEAASLRLSNHY